MNGRERVEALLFSKQDELHIRERARGLIKAPPEVYEAIDAARAKVAAASRDIIRDLDALEAARGAAGPLRAYLESEACRGYDDSTETYRITERSIALGKLRALLAALDGKGER
jgi:hypothetical protein